MEWAVRPPASNCAAMPLLAVAKAICRKERTLARMRFMRNVFPVPPGASMNSIPLSLLRSLAKMVV